MSSKIPNGFIKARVESTKKKVVFIKDWLKGHPIIGEHFDVVFREANKALLEQGMDPLAHNALRKMRHAERKRQGLAFDGITYPKSREQQANYRGRVQVAVEIAITHHGVIGYRELSAAVEKATGFGLGSVGCREALHKAQRVLKSQSAKGDPVQLPLPTPPPIEVPVVRRRKAMTDRVQSALASEGAENGMAGDMMFVAGDVMAALQLLAPAMKAAGIHRVTVNVDVNGIATYDAVRETVETMKGLV